MLGSGMAWLSRRFEAWVQDHLSPDLPTAEKANKGTKSPQLALGKNGEKISALGKNGEEFYKQVVKTVEKVVPLARPYHHLATAAMYIHGKPLTRDELLKITSELNTILGANYSLKSIKNAVSKILVDNTITKKIEKQGEAVYYLRDNIVENITHALNSHKDKSEIFGDGVVTVSPAAKGTPKNTSKNGNDGNSRQSANGDGKGRQNDFAGYCRNCHSFAGNCRLFGIKYSDINLLTLMDAMRNGLLPLANSQNFGLIAKTLKGCKLSPDLQKRIYCLYKVLSMSTVFPPRISLSISLLVDLFAEIFALN